MPPRLGPPCVTVKQPPGNLRLCPSGVARQLQALISSAERVDLLSDLKQPDSLLLWGRTTGNQRSRLLKKNFPDCSVLAADVREISNRDLLLHGGLKSAPDLIAGGPPCQGFSSAGARRTGDSRNSLVGEFARLVAETSPRAFLFENVEGFLTTDSGRFVFDLLDPVIEAGYGVVVRKFNVANWGVPQLRKRVIAIGVLDGDPPELWPTHRAFGAPGVHRVGPMSLP